jgi:hypothetical protein
MVEIEMQDLITGQPPDSSADPLSSIAPPFNAKEKVP